MKRKFVPFGQEQVIPPGHTYRLTINYMECGDPDKDGTDHLKGVEMQDSMTAIFDEIRNIENNPATRRIVNIFIQLIQE